MSKNKFMHMRNPYRKSPDFLKIAENFPEMKEICKQDATGGFRVDFKNPKALRLLTKALLKCDFELDVEIPADKLVPTLPLRINYILWIEDILTTLAVSNATGLDIGCGASCVYPLLAAKWKKWQMFGTDISQEITNCAEKNAQNNNLSDKIKIFKLEEGDSIFHKVLNDLGGQQLDFCMCNPPFFEDANDQPENRTGTRAQPKNAPTGSSTELACDGGELAFITRIIEESNRVKNQVSVFTTMIGIKYHLTMLVRKLREMNITNFIDTQFCQGNTTRWGLAWTHREDIFLRRVPCINPTFLDGNTKTVNFSLTSTDEMSIKFLTEKLRKMLEDLEISLEILEENVTRVDWIIRAQMNAWSHQRRKRREMMKNQDEISRKPKRPRLEDKPVLVAEVILTPRDRQMKLEITYLDGTLGKDGIHQILQFIMNNWRKNDPSSPRRSDEYTKDQEAKKDSEKN
ncbi:U6 small nuclear RNA (adenine-(43)-N(6))-methyltransferase [Sergentomyia squamirostris]